MRRPRRSTWGLAVFVVLTTQPVSCDWCPNFCSGHGVCLTDDICQCFDEWSGFDCSERTCPFGLSWVLSPKEVQNESSTPSYPLGERAYVECSGKGECNRHTGVCQCYEGFSGVGCRRNNCPNDCSGNGICVLESDVEGYYGDSNLLFAQKQYWNGRKTRRCMCDSHFWGNDCSQRLCPQGVDPDVEFCDDIKRSKDVQTVTVALANDLEAIDSAHIDQYFTLTFTDNFDARLTTRPISFWEDADGVQEALLALPNFAIDDVEVVKFFPLNDYDGSVSPDRGASFTSTLQSAGHLREITCERLHFDLFSNTACADDDDCLTNFGLDSNRLFCDANIMQCVETNRDKCEVVDGKTEFSNNTCATNFEPNGIYEDSLGQIFWGRRLSALDRSCHVGNFPPDDVKYARPCNSDDDCVQCSPWSQIRGGVCNEGVCGVSDEYKAVMAQDAINECRVASFAIKFTSAVNVGTQSLFECNFGSSGTEKDGSCPKFRSAGLASCHVLRTGVPEWEYTDAAKDEMVEAFLCYETDEDLKTTALFVLETEALSGSYDRCFRLNSPDDMVDDIRYVTADQSAVVRVVEPVASTTDFTTLKGIYYKDDPIFTESEIEIVEDAVYDEVLPCSNEGTCTTQGTCDCRTGFHGVSCEKALDFM